MMIVEQADSVLWMIRCTEYQYAESFLRDKPKKIVFIGHYLSESIYNDFINGENIDLKDSIDKSIEVRIRKYIR